MKKKWMRSLASILAFSAAISMTACSSGLDDGNMQNATMAQDAAKEETDG